MHLLLSYYNPDSVLTIFKSTEPNKNPTNLILIQHFLELFPENGFNEGTIIDDNKREHSIVNIVFSIPSDWNVKKSQKLVLFVILDRDQDAKKIKPLLISFAQRFLAESNIYKGFYVDDENKRMKDLEVSQKFDKIGEFFEDLYQQFLSLFQETVLGQILILGMPSVGKTSILHRLTKKSFNESIRPTLGLQMTRVIVENFNFNAIDIGGQFNIRETWRKLTIPPQAIIFVIDLNSKPAEQQESLILFNRIMSYFFDETNPNHISTNTPILLLGNKLDLMPNFKKKEIITFYQPDRLKLNSDVFLVSAKLDIHVIKAFRWLIAQLVQIVE